MSNAKLAYSGHIYKNNDVLKIRGDLFDQMTKAEDLLDFYKNILGFESGEMDIIGGYPKADNSL